MGATYSALSEPASKDLHDHDGIQHMRVERVIVEMAERSPVLAEA